MSWKLSISVAVSWDALVPRAHAAPKAMPGGEIYIRPERAEQLLFHTRALPVSETSPCKPPAETEFFCRTSHALVEGGGRSSSATLQSKKLHLLTLTTCCRLICCSTGSFLFCAISQQIMFVSNTA